MSGRQPLGELSAPPGIGVRTRVRRPDIIAKEIIDWTESAINDFEVLADFQECLNRFYKYKNEEKSILLLRDKLEFENINPLFINYQSTRAWIEDLQSQVDREMREYIEYRNLYEEYLNDRLRMEAAQYIQGWWRNYYR